MCIWLCVFVFDAKCCPYLTKVHTHPSLPGHHLHFNNVFFLLFPRTFPSSHLYRTNVLHLTVPHPSSVVPLTAGGCWKSILRICLVSYSRNVVRPAFCLNISFLVVHFTVKNVNIRQLETNGLQQLNKSLIYSQICRFCCCFCAV